MLHKLCLAFGLVSYKEVHVLMDNIWLYLMEVDGTHKLQPTMFAKWPRGLVHPSH